MSIIAALIFGIVQGLTEFLPVSSSGHLALLGHFFGLGEQAILTAVLLHVATFFSVCIVMRKQVFYLLQHPFGEKARKIYLASAITFGIVFLLKGTVEKSFENIKFLPWCFLVTAVLLLTAEFYSKNLFKNKPLDYKRAAIIGAVQGIAALPGISRRGSTISAAMLCKVGREEATDFSFILSLPIIAASALWEFLKLKGETAQNFAVLPNIIAVVLAFTVGIFAIKLMQKLMKKAKMWWFSVYLFLVAIAIFIFV